MTTTNDETILMMMMATMTIGDTNDKLCHSLFLILV